MSRVHGALSDGVTSVSRTSTSATHSMCFCAVIPLVKSLGNRVYKYCRMRKTVSIAGSGYNPGRSALALQRSPVLFLCHLLTSSS